MAQINLLKQKKATIDIWQVVTSLTVKLLAVVLVLLVCYYIYLFIQAKNTENNISVVESKIQDDRKALAVITNRDELFTRQQQLTELQSLLKSHEYWSGLLPVLKVSTLNQANYAAIRALADGNISMTLSVPSVEELDKFLQVFDLPAVYKNFSDVRIGSIAKSQTVNGIATSVEVRMKYNPAILQYKQPNQ